MKYLPKGLLLVDEAGIVTHFSVIAAHTKASC